MPEKSRPLHGPSANADRRRLGQPKHRPVTGRLVPVSEAALSGCRWGRHQTLRCSGGRLPRHGRRPAEPRQSIQPHAHDQQQAGQAPDLCALLGHQQQARRNTEARHKGPHAKMFMRHRLAPQHDHRRFGADEHKQQRHYGLGPSRKITNDHQCHGHQNGHPRHAALGQHTRQYAGQQVLVGHAVGQPASQQSRLACRRGLTRRSQEHTKDF